KVSDRYIRKMLTKLKKIGLIEQVKVSGFRRVLRVCPERSAVKVPVKAEQKSVKAEQQFHHTKENKAFFQKAKETTTTDSKPKASRGVDPKVSSSSPYQEMKTAA